jgi:hypothetical protein
MLSYELGAQNANSMNDWVKHGLYYIPPGPCAPVGPLSPVAPVGPCGPTGPSCPLAPWSPVGPEKQITSLLYAI